MKKELLLDIYGYPKLINSFSNIKRSNANTRVYIIEVLNKKKYI